MTKPELYDLIADGKLKDAIDGLRKLVKGNAHLNNQVLSIASDYSDMVGREIANTISPENLSVKRNLIVSRLTGIIDQLPNIKENDPNSPVIPQQSITPESSFRKYLWLFAIIVVIIGSWGIFRYLSKPILAQFQQITINLHGQNGILDNPLKEGLVMISFVDTNFSKEAAISQKGQVVFDSIPIELKGKSFACKLTAKANFRLKEGAKIYALVDKVNVEVEKIDTTTGGGGASNTPKPKPKPCPSTTPNGEALDNKNYKPHETQLNHVWVSGKWEKVNGECVWKGGYWKKLTILTVSDCPTAPPANAVISTPGTARPGFFWQPSQWVVQDGKCEWRAGSWQKKQAG